MVFSGVSKTNNMTAIGHTICITCWKTRLLRPDTPRRTQGIVKAEACCWCGSLTTEGIYMIQADNRVPCKGVHQSPAAAGEAEQTPG